ncbi:MAG: aconitate hydratase AcnA [Sphingomonadaceae bacterium]|nr:aconitate hydratase AcnA [Sphingomonadaceae bacterium]
MDWVRGDGPRWASVPDYLAGLGINAVALPRSVRIVLEAALVGHARGQLGAAECEAIARWRPGAAGAAEWRFPVTRVLMQDASGLPLLADLAALRDEVARHGRDPATVDLAVPAALVIDHSIDADNWGSGALARNMDVEFARNGERYAFARWAEQAFASLQVVPPGNGIVHQVHLERIAELVSVHDGWAACDTVIGTDSHTTMVNGLGVLGWGVGGIEAEAALLGQPLSFAAPEVIGVELSGTPRPGIYGADLALAITARLRAEKVVGAFLEFFGLGVATLAVADRNSIANMAPEYGATLALFPADDAVLAYLRAHCRDDSALAAARSHLEGQGLFGAIGEGIVYDRVIRVDLGTIAPALAGPSLPHQHVPLPEVARGFAAAYEGEPIDGRVVLAAITSCTNTANLRSLVAAGLLARAAVTAGMRPPPHVKTVFAPGSRAATAALGRCGLLAPLEALGFAVAAYGCGPCVGNTGNLADGIEDELAHGRIAVAVQSGNRNFEGRIHHAIRAAYLGNPMLVVAYALAGRIDSDIEALLARIAPTDAEVDAVLAADRGEARPGWHLPEQWLALPQGIGSRFAWSGSSTFFVPPPFFQDREAPPLRPIADARPLLVLGDAVTTDHISPVGAIARDSEAAAYLGALGVSPADVGSYSARRVNHEVMLRGTFANPRLRNRLVEAVGPVTRSMPAGTPQPIHIVAEAYRAAERPIIVLAGHNYGAGSARDWAAKGTALLGIRAVLARSFERIHRANLVALGVLPILIEGGEDPWSGIGVESTVSVSIDFDPGTATPRMALAVALRVDGQAQTLRGRLMALTSSEIAQLSRGTLFDVCRDDALRL